MTIFKSTAVRRKAPDTVTIETSPWRDHFDLVADCVLLKHESRSEFFKTLVSMIDEYRPATFTEASLVAGLAANRWRQFRCCRLFAAVSASEQSGRAGLLKLLARQERHCKRLYNRDRRILLKVLSARVNNLDARTRPPAVASQRTRKNAPAAGNSPTALKARLV